MPRKTTAAKMKEQEEVTRLTKAEKEKEEMR